jgi:two-component system CheB/CheR fusion protein
MSADAQPTQAAPAEAAPPQEPAPSLVVGVGASAGGLEAFKDLLAEVPAGAGLTFLFAQHLEPHQPSLLVELLSKATPLTVRTAEQGEELRPDTVYVLPPNAVMSVHGGRIDLLPRAARRALNMPIDHLLRSLAEDMRDRAVGVVLSGGGTDGTLGLVAVKAEGGVTFAQDEQSARHDSMPRSAAAECRVDYVLPPGGIARQLVRLARHPFAADAAEPAVGPQVESALGQVLGLVRSAGGVGLDALPESAAAWPCAAWTPCPSTWPSCATTPPRCRPSTRTS